MDDTPSSFPKKRADSLRGFDEHRIPKGAEAYVRRDENDNPRDVTITSRSSSPQTCATRQHLLPRKPVGSSPGPQSTNVIAQAVHKRGHAHFIKNWWMEITACLIFVVALLAIVVTLRPHQDKPLPQWPYHISVNTLISIYVVILKGAVLLVIANGLGQLKWRWFRNHRPLEDIVQYDSATRGPLGALSLLLRLRLRHPLSSCGALITVLMLIIDPFAQQIIRYYDCSLSIHGHQATIPRTNLHVSDGTHIGAAQISIPAGIQSAINAGIFSPGGFVTPSCQTGNCSFIQSYSTVGYCGRCTDITNELRFSFTNTTIEYVGSESDSFTSVSVLSYLPSGTSVNSSNTFSPESGAIGNDVWNLATMNHITNCQNQSEQDCMEIIVAKNPTLRDPASGPQSDALSSTCQSGNNTWLCQGYGAASCTLNPCVRTYEASLSSGNFEEISLADTGDGEIWGEQELSGISGRTYLATIDTECITPLEKSSLASAGYLVEPNVHWLPYHLAFDPAIVSNSSFPSSMLEHGCLYVIDDWFVSSLWGSYLTHFFNGTINGFEDENKQINYFNGPQNLQTIYNYGNISFDRVNSIFQNISDAMTTYIRQNGQDNHSNPALGLVMHDETCLEVRWGWLALPAVLVLGTIVFFAAMVIETRPTGGRAHIWKSSPLALIFHGLDEPNSLQTTRVLEENDDMEQRAKEIIVRLANTGGGLNLVASSNMEKRVEGRV